MTVRSLSATATLAAVLLVGPFGPFGSGGRIGASPLRDEPRAGAGIELPAAELPAAERPAAERPAIEFPDVPDIRGELPAAPPAVQETPPSAEALLEELRAAFTMDSMAIVARMSVRRGGSVRVLDVSLWTRGDHEALLRVREPQRLAGRALLRDGDTVWLYEPEWGRVYRAGPEGSHAPWGRLALRIVDAVVGDPLPGRYRPVAVRPARRPGAAWTLVLRARADGLRCEELEVDVAAVTHALVEARCERGDEGAERWRFDRHRDFGGRLLPTEVVVDLVGSEGWSATLQILSLGVDVPLSDALFTRAGLAGLR